MVGVDVHIGSEQKPRGDNVASLNRLSFKSSTVREVQGSDQREYDSPDFRLTVFPLQSPT